LATREKEELLEWHKHAIFKNALSDEKYYSMVQDMIDAQEVMNDDYYKMTTTTSQDNISCQEEQSEIQILSSKMGDTTLD
jgi:hypothetical protein